MASCQQTLIVPIFDRHSISRRRLLEAGGALIASTGANGFAYASARAGSGGRLHILHTNDMHSRLEHAALTTAGRAGLPQGDHRSTGGAARLATAVRRRRAEMLATGVPVVTLDAGDQSQGTLFYTTYGGMAEIEMMNLVGYDAMTLGNHEFNRGPESLARMLAAANFPIVSGNTHVASGHPLAPLVRDHLVLDAGGVKIGLLGVTLPETAALSSPGKAVRFSDPATHLGEAVGRLRAQGLRNIIVLSHLGLFSDLALAARVAGISLIVGGHSHTFMSNKTPGAPPYAMLVPNTSGRTVPVVHAYAYGRFLGDLTVEFDDDGAVSSARGEPVELAGDVFPEAPDVAARVAALARPIEKIRQTEVAVLSAPIDASRSNCRARECEMGNTIAEAMLSRVAPTGVSIAVANSGALRTSLAAGRVTLDDVFGVLPFQNTLFTMDLTGAQVVETLETGVSRLEARTGAFPQVAGLRFRLDPLAPPHGGRVRDVLVRSPTGWTPIDPAAVYSVVVSSFTAAGGDGYAILTQGLNRYDTAIDLADALAEYLAANAPFAPRLDGRIVQ